MTRPRQQLLATIVVVGISGFVVAGCGADGSGQDDETVTDTVSADTDTITGGGCSVADDCLALAGPPRVCRVWTCEDRACSEASAADGATCPGDDNACTTDRCEAGVCAHTFNPDCECEGFACPPTGEYGDSLELTYSGRDPIETVETEIIDGFIFDCGGFGLDVLRRAPDDSLSAAGQLLPRCQNVVGGPILPDGARRIFATNHGDAWVPEPTLYGFRLDRVTGAVSGQMTLRLDGVSPEGVEYDDASTTLWVALHTAGVRRYGIDPTTGAPTEIDTIIGFENAQRIFVKEDHAYVSDGNGGLKIVNATAGTIVGSATTDGFARDVVVTHDMAFVTASAQGVQVFDVSDPTAPTPIRTLFTDGQPLQLAVFDGGDKVVVANFLDVVVLDSRHPEALRILAVDRGSSSSSAPRVLGVAADDNDGGYIAVGEWLGTSILRYRDGLIGPEFDLDRFDVVIGDTAVGASKTESIQVSNRGFFPLVIDDIIRSTDDPTWSVFPTTLTLQPGELGAINITYTPQDPDEHTLRLTLPTNDPDEPTPTLTVTGNPNALGRLGLGDALTADFDFLDVDRPEGEKAIGNLEGNILVLAYFATF